MLSNCAYISEEAFISACSRYGLILDANTLLLYIVGRNRPEEIEHFSRTKDQYIADDYRVLKYYIDKSNGKKIITTPYIISEVVHLLEIDPQRIKKNRNQSTPKYFDEAMSIFKYISEHIKDSPTKNIINTYPKTSVLRFGIPDLSLVEAANEQSAFLSTDRELCDEMYFNKKMPALYYGAARARHLNLKTPR